MFPLTAGFSLRIFSTKKCSIQVKIVQKYKGLLDDKMKTSLMIISMLLVLAKKSSRHLLSCDNAIFSQ